MAMAGLIWEGHSALVKYDWRMGIRLYPFRAWLQKSRAIIQRMPILTSIRCHLQLGGSVRLPVQSTCLLLTSPVPRRRTVQATLGTHVFGE